MKVMCLYNKIAFYPFASNRKRDTKNNCLVHLHRVIIVFEIHSFLRQTGNISAIEKRGRGILR
jgi:hypothetical protein